MAGLTAIEDNFSYGVQAARALVVGDDAAAVDLAVRALEEGGCSVLRPVSLARAVADRSLFDGIHVLWIEGGDAPGASPAAAPLQFMTR